MSRKRRAVLLIGSPKVKPSTSQVLGEYLMEQLGINGMETQTIGLPKHLRAEDTVSKMLGKTDDADLVVLAFPLYVDCLPYTATKALELIAEHRKKAERKKGQRFMAIVNSGFPEAGHSDVAVDICRIFSGRAGFEWAGALVLGGGGYINGRPLEDLGGPVKKVKNSLEITAEALAKGGSVPDDARDMMAKPMVPKKLYTMGGNMGWKKAAKKHGGKIKARPYLE